MHILLAVDQRLFGVLHSALLTKATLEDLHDNIRVALQYVVLCQRFLRWCRCHHGSAQFAFVFDVTVRCKVFGCTPTVRLPWLVIAVLD